MFRNIVLAVTLVLVSAVAANAQQPTRAAIQSVSHGGEVRVQVNVTFFVSGPVNESDASLKSQQEARRKLYESAARECDVLLAAIATECHVQSININVNRNYGNQIGEGFNASGNFGYRVTLK